MNSLSVLYCLMFAIAATASNPVADANDASVKCTKPNEEWVACQPDQIWELCEDRFNSPPFVAFPCDPRCTCITGYYKDSTGKCIPKNECCQDMSVILAGAESFRPEPRYGQVKGEASVYYQRPRCGQPRPQPKQKESGCYKSEPSNAPKERPCWYDYPCKADCFNHGGATRPSGRYARTVWYPGENPATVPPCQAFSCPNPPFHPCCYYTCGRHV